MRTSFRNDTRPSFDGFALGAPRPATDGETPSWFAARTRARAEKAALRFLRERQTEVYLPLVEKERRWADRTQKVEFPLFPGYVFVRAHPSAIGSVLSAPMLVDVVRFNGAPAPLRNEELSSVRALVEGARKTGALPTAADYLQEGDPIKVVSGPFSGLTGVLVEGRGRTRVVVRLTALRQAVGVEMDRSCLRLSA